MSVVHVASEHLMDHRLSSYILDDRDVFISSVQKEENYWASSDALVCSHSRLFCCWDSCRCVLSRRRVSLLYILVPVQLT